MKKKNHSTIFLILIFLLGLSLLLYPSISDYVNSLHQSRAVADYDAAVAAMTEKDYSGLFAQAEQYNDCLAGTPDAFYDPSLLEDYNEILDITGTGIMGYISIEKIGVELPIYHGTEEGVLQVACGHLEGTSLPVGGESTHSVLSAHRGLPSAKLFTNLDELEPEDTFTITVLDRVLTYEVDQISIVKPNEVDSLRIEPGKDYCTLVTCTPYAVNTHRLLVRGTRIETITKPLIHVASEAYKIDPIIVTPIVAIPMLLILLILLLISPGKKRRER